MHILLVTPWYKPDIGGVASSVSTLARTLVTQGNRCSILVLDDSSRSPERIDTEAPDLNIWSYRLRPIYYHRRPLRTFVAFWTYFLPTLVTLRRFIRREKVDLVEVHFPGSWSLYFAALRRFYGLRYTVYVHGSDVMVNPREHFLAYWATALTLQSANALVACSRRMLADTQRIFHMLPKISRARYTGIRPEWAEQGNAIKPQSLGLIPGKYILCNAFPIHVKGADILLQAFSLIAPRFPDIQLALLGKNRDGATIRDMVNRYSLHGRVKLIGSVPNDDLPSIIKGTIFGVIPSRREGLPRVALEFQLLGKAVIAANVGGLPETITDGFNGFLVSPEDPRSLAERMSFCLEHPDILVQMGRNGRSQVIQSYTDRVGGREAVDLYETVVGDGVNRPVRQPAV